MIEDDDIELHKQKQPKNKKKVNPKTLTYLESLPWRPVGVEW